MPAKSWLLIFLITASGIAIPVTWMYSSRMPSLNQTNIGNSNLPPDLVLLITKFRKDLTDGGISIIPAQNNAPWSDESYLTADERKDPDIKANCRAIRETMKHIWFFAQTDERDFIGYWRGPNDREICDSPLVVFDTEGQFYDYPSVASSLQKFAIRSPSIAMIRESLKKAKFLDTPKSGSGDPSPDAFHLQRYETYNYKKNP